MSARGQRAAESRLRQVRAPQEAQAEERAWRVVRQVYAGRPVDARPATTVARRRVRVALAPAVAVIAGILALTPAGAAVHRWIEHTLGVPHARPALFSLPAPGEVLVSGPGGAWTVGADGSRRRLGFWRDASWSPHALYVAVSGENELVALNRRGATRWSLARPDVRFPRWFAPDGFRVAYLSGLTLRVVAGDGTGDRELAPHVALVAPSWRPGHPYTIAYVRADGAVVVRDADTGTIAWTRRVDSAPRLVSWSPNGARLLVKTHTSAYVYAPDGRLVVHRVAAPGEPLFDAALSPDGATLALLTPDAVTLMDLARPDAVPHRVFSGSTLRQLAFSPDGRWLLVSWVAADQWVFIRVVGPPRIVAVSRIAEQFDEPGRYIRTFPFIEGWCCTPGGGSG